jgi:hypothetical protein
VSFEGTALARYLRAPEQLAGLRLEDWDRLVPTARRAGLLARLTLLVERTIGLDAVPAPARPHLVSSTTLAEKHVRDTWRELDRLLEVLTPVVGRLVLLKGGAYVAADLPPAKGRTFNDIDILVPKDRLADVETMLQLAGWSYGDIDPYDEQYYRRWMHQLPPLTNASIGSSLDVHHGLVPATARIRLDAALVLAEAVPVPGRPALAVLAPPDMVLHSAVHLLNEGDYEHGLRDLHDLDLLLRHFGTAPEFWRSLAARGRALNLTRPLYYALRYTAAAFGTPVPAEINREAEAWAPPWPGGRGAMDALFGQALRSPHPAAATALTAPALWLLYIRAHYLRMPLPLLLPHLARKAMRRDPTRPEVPRG